MKKHFTLARTHGVAFAENEKKTRQIQSLQIKHSEPKRLPKIDKILEETLIANDISKKLTKRELQVLQLVVAGKTNKQIAAIFSRTQRTVEYHRNCLMKKLEAHNAAQLVKKAIQMGIKMP